MALVLQSRLTYEEAHKRIVQSLERADPEESIYTPGWSDLEEMGWMTPSMIAEVILEELGFQP